MGFNRKLQYESSPYLSGRKVNEGKMKKRRRWATGWKLMHCSRCYFQDYYCDVGKRPCPFCSKAYKPKYLHVKGWIQ